MNKSTTKKQIYLSNTITTSFKNATMTDNQKHGLVYYFSFKFVGRSTLNTI